MPDFLSLHDADRIAQESAPIAKPGLARVFTGMIRDPARTLSEAFAHPIQSYAVILAALGGVYWALNLAVAQAGGETLTLPQILTGIVILGLVGGVAYMYALTILMFWSCDILGGQPGRRKIRTLLAYAGVPGLIAMVAVAIPRVAIFGHSLFLSSRPWREANPVLVWGLWFGDAICFSWSMLLVVKGLKLMNGFTTGKAIAAAVLPAVPIALIGLLFLFIAWTGIFFAPPAF